VHELVEALAAELERVRELSPRVLNYISGTYGIDHDAVGAFLVDEMPKLEDYEIDLILSPVFTPKLTDQAVFADVLGGRSVPREEFPELIRSLVARPTRAQLLTPDNKVHAVALREVTVERYVHRLRLEGGIPKSMADLMDQASFAAGERPMLKAVARRAVWDNEGPRQILARYLANAGSRGGHSMTDTLDLLDLVEGRKPADLADLIQRMPGWAKALHEQIDGGAAPRPFFNEDVRMMHGGGRDQRREGDSRVSAKEKELDFLVRLQQILA
jgi:hypothetical protein